MIQNLWKKVASCSPENTVIQSENSQYYIGCLIASRISMSVGDDDKESNCTVEFPLSKDNKQSWGSMIYNRQKLYMRYYKNVKFNMLMWS